ncbi:unnamed protein product [Darwinula stevensoni]|uniref:pyruvate kinase n=1 Tax=Darwinula stevensoni TaxID=69355 RepID=A0A7R9A4S3_9CRUS|nr:unnamed protein product [Darwinula stevensoni]CAG0893130.1 unnamed protein product [Darwinula stevensoni]
MGDPGTAFGPEVPKLTGIVCTVGTVERSRRKEDRNRFGSSRTGPASRSVETLKAMYREGATIVRLDFSHGTHDYHLETLRMVREAEAEADEATGYAHCVAVALDTEGPEIRTGRVRPVCRLPFDGNASTVDRSLDALEGRSKRRSGRSIVRGIGTGDVGAKAVPGLRSVARRPRGPREALSRASVGPPTTAGSRTRDGRQGKEVVLERGRRAIVSTDPARSDACSERLIYVDRPNLATAVRPGQRIFVDDGLLSLVVRNVLDDRTVEVEVENGGCLGDRKGVNLPGVPVDLPAVTEKDEEDLEFAAAHDLDFVFASFVRDAAGVREIRSSLRDSSRKSLRDSSRKSLRDSSRKSLRDSSRKSLRERASPDRLRAIFSLRFFSLSSDFLFPRSVAEEKGAKPGRTKIVSKIENRQGLENLHEIVAESDGVMVARGDFGANGEIESLADRKSIVAACIAAGKPAIVATQTMDPTARNPLPTSAEVSDVGNAVLDGADCVMLGAETAAGERPVLAVRIAAEICAAVEANGDRDDRVPEPLERVRLSLLAFSLPR